MEGASKLWDVLKSTAEEKSSCSHFLRRDGLMHMNSEFQGVDADVSP